MMEWVHHLEWVQDDMISQLIDKDVVVQAEGVRVKGKIVAYSHYWPFEPQLLVIQDKLGDWIVLRHWSVVGEVKQ